MNQNPFLVILVSFVFLSSSSKSEEVVQTALLNFFVKLGPGNEVSASDPCMRKGVLCDAKTSKVERLLLEKKSNGGLSTDEILMFVGYILVGLIVIIFIVYKFCKRGKEKEDDTMFEVDQKKVIALDDSNIKLEIVSDEYESVSTKSHILVASAESAGKGSPCAVVSTSPEVSGLKFEELLKASAELLGRGKHGSVYKVMCESIGKHLTVKRIKDSSISSDEFKQRMKRLDQVRHPNVLPPVAFYTSKEEKLVVYEYQSNGSLFKLIHGNFLSKFARKD